MSDVAERPDLTRILSVLASFVIVVAGMKAASTILVPFLLAVFLAIICAPMFLELRRRRVPSVLALLVMVLVLVGVSFLALSVVRASLNGFSENLPGYQLRLQAQTADLWRWLDDRGIDVPEGAISEALSPRAAMGYLGTVTAALSGVLANTFLILLVVIFILLEAAVLPAKVRAMPGLSEAAWVRLQQIVEQTRRYVSLKTMMSLVTGVLVGIWLAAMGVDYPVLMGLLAFLLNYVPNIGSIVAGVPGVLLAFVQFGPGSAAVTAAGYVAINVVIGNLLEPRLMGRGLGLSPLVILISMIFWGWVLGPVGMLLSVPLTMTVKIAMESGHDTRWIALLMGSAAPQQDA